MFITKITKIVGAVEKLEIIGAISDLPPKDQSISERSHCFP